MLICFRVRACQSMLHSSLCIGLNRHDSITVGKKRGKSLFERLFLPWRDSLVSSEEVRLSCYRVEERGVDLVFGKTRAQFTERLRGILLHGGLTEDPEPVTWE